MICPGCHGERVIIGFACRSNGESGIARIACDRCAGTGSVSDEMADWIARGKSCKARRVEPYQNLRAVAEKMGLAASEVSAWETGRADPTPLEQWWEKQVAPPRTASTSDGQGESE